MGFQGKLSPFFFVLSMGVLSNSLYADSIWDEEEKQNQAQFAEARRFDTQIEERIEKPLQNLLDRWANKKERTRYREVYAAIDSLEAIKLEGEKLKTEISAQNKSSSSAGQIARINATLKVVDSRLVTFKQVAHEERSIESSSSSASSGSKRYSCEFMCRGSGWATGGRHTFEVSANSRDGARDAVKPQADELCLAEGRSRSGAWWADVSICDEK
jgi:hypothetical protein